MLRRPLGAGALLLLAYVGLSLLTDDRGYLGTDTGGKVATLEVMTDLQALDPDIGYWAERWDPQGRVHPLYYTSHIGPRWVNATTLPVLYAAYPLYRLGGYRLALVLSMLGSVLAALAARALARRLSGGDGWAAFWLVGLASPLLIYALDIWEHSLGVAAMTWAVVLLVDVVDGRRRAGAWAFAGAGALFGLAATMRTEAVVYAFVAVGLCAVVLVGRGQVVRALRGGAASVAAFAIPLGLNHWLEVATVGQAIRFQRATGTAAAAVSGTASVSGGGGAGRFKEALLNAVGLIPAMEPRSYLVGTALLLLLVYLSRQASRAGDPGPAVLAALGVALLYLIRFADGPGFIPSLVAATPLAVVGVTLGWRRSGASAYVLAVGLGALPLVWATQFQGGAAPQWAGRYLLVSGLLFGVVGIVALPRLEQWVRISLVALAVTVTGFGYVWTVIRTHDVGRASADLAGGREPVLVSRIGHLLREGGIFYPDHRGLTAPRDDDQRFAAEVIAKAGYESFAVVQITDQLPLPPMPGWRQTGRRELDLFAGLGLTVVSYEATAGGAAP